ncbi:hypothetical protein YTPLAS18_11670 [Nitrospira sp.]|nr:hypothetical protein YTPLAS18_11670 [Nitrospira sp.]
MAKKQKDVRLSKRAAKAVASIAPLFRDAIKEALRDIATDPLLGIPLKGQLNPLRRLRVGKYHIVYGFTETTVDVVHIAHRKDAYR